MSSFKSPRNLRSHIPTRAAVLCAASTMALFATDAAAQCASTAPNETECTGTEPGPVVVTGNNQTVRVRPGAQVQNLLRVNGDDSLVENEGEIETTTTRIGVWLDANGGNAQVDNSGVIDATDPGTGLGAIGVFIENTGAGGRAIIGSTGTISAQGDIATAIQLNAGAATGAVQGNLGASSLVEAQGDLVATGVFAQAGASVDFVNDGAIRAIVTNLNSSAVGLVSSATTVSSQVRNRGTIEASGAFASGLTQTGSGFLSIANEGTITAISGGSGATAIRQSIGNGDSLIDNTGTLSSNQDAIRFTRFGAGESQISNGATGVIEGVERAIYADTFAGTFQILNAGTIRSSSTVNNPAAIATILLQPGAGSTGSDIFIENSGVIAATGPQAIRAMLGTADTFSLGNSGTITGNILVRAGNPATVLNSGTIAGNISLTDNDDLVQMSGASAVHTGALRGRGGSDRLEILQTTGFVFDGLVESFETVLVDDGSIVFDGASFTAAGAPFAMTIADDASALLRGSAGFALDDGGTITLAGTLTVDPDGAFTATSANDVAAFVAADGSTVRFGLDSGANLNGQIRADTITFATGSQIDIDVRDLGVLVNGTTFDVAVARDTLTDDSGALTDNSVLFDFTKQVVGGTVLQITMQQLLTIADTINPTDPNSAALAGGLQGLIDTGSPAGNTVSTALGQFSTVAELADAVADFAPDNSNAAALLLLDAIDRTHRIVRLRDQSRAIETGDIAIWLHGALLGAGLDREGVLDGFEGDGWDLAGGIDARFGESGLIGGLGFGFGGGDHERDGMRRAGGSYDASRIFAYLATTAGKVHFNADIGIGWGTADTTRSIDVLSETAIGTTGIDQTFGRAEIGYILGAPAGTPGFSFTPVLGFQFAEVSSDAYAEAGSAGALSFAERSVSSSRGDLGAIIAWSGGAGDAAGWSLTADLRWQEEFGDLADPLRANFVGGGNAFDYAVNMPGSSAFSAELGAAFSLGSAGNVTLGYRGVFGGGADSQAGSITYSLGF